MSRNYETVRIELEPCTSSVMKKYQGNKNVIKIKILERVENKQESDRVWKKWWFLQIFGLLYIEVVWH